MRMGACGARGWREASVYRSMHMQAPAAAVGAWAVAVIGAGSNSNQRQACAATRAGDTARRERPGPWRGRGSSSSLQAEVQAELRGPCGARLPAAAAAGRVPAAPLLAGPYINIQTSEVVAILIKTSGSSQNTSTVRQLY